MELNGNNLLWFFAFLFLAGGNGFGGLFGNRNVPMGPPPATQADVTEAVNNQSIQAQLNALGIATSNNNFEMAKQFMDQNLSMQSQNNTNLINIIQGFNSVVQQMQANTANLSNKIDQLGYHMDSCCCEIKTQMLQNKLDDANATIVKQQNEISNQQQTANILNALGRFVAWAGSGSQAATAAAAG